LGIFGGAILQRTDLKVSRGDRFFMYSDGLIESSPGGGRREGVERLVDACVRTRDLPLPESANAIVRQVAGNSPEDDLLLLAAEVADDSPPRFDCELHNAAATLEAVEEFSWNSAAQPGHEGTGELLRSRIAGPRGADQRRIARLRRGPAEAGSLLAAAARKTPVDCGRGRWRGLRLARRARQIRGCFG
jgi:hypothetical protein